MSGLKPKHQIAMWLAVAGLVVLTGCAGPWQNVSGTIGTSRWTATIPNEWMRLVMADYEMFSRDGTHLHYILFQERPLDKRFRFTRKQVERDMLPHEVAQTVVDDLRADPQIRNFTLLSNAPITVGGMIGFRLQYAYIDPTGVEMQTDFYGALLPDVLFNVRYTAARRHYFAKYQADFDQVVRSLRLNITP